MSRLALLFGVSGAGKGHIAKMLLKKVSPLHVIASDLIQQHIAGIIAPSLKAVRVMDPSLGEKWANLPNSKELFANSIRERYPIPEDCRWILAQGDFLSYPAWQAAFLQGVTATGATIRAVKSFWIDPDPQEVFGNVRTRNRPQDENRNYYSEAMRVTDYRRRLERNDCFRSEDSVAVARAICRFFDSAV